ncbi:lamin tail domain-containing protein [Streptomyces sp. NPDC002566]|uniref:lamin tail domain-containing protein n=1 Tax=Streptomyces sp. NPDC002566 TaxID=3364650 RepID=UPI0036B92C10
MRLQPPWRPRPGPVVRTERPKAEISAVQDDSPGRDDRSNRSLNKEWVDDQGHTYTFEHYRLASRATVRIHTGIGRDTRTDDLYQNRRHCVWNNDRDTATLRTDRRRFVDQETWGGHRR